MEVSANQASCSRVGLHHVTVLFLRWAVGEVCAVAQTDTAAAVDTAWGVAGSGWSMTARGFRTLGPSRLVWLGSWWVFSSATGVPSLQGLLGWWRGVGVIG